MLHTHKSITNKAKPKFSPSYLSTVAGHRHPHTWPNRGHSPPPGLRKAQHHCNCSLYCLHTTPAHSHGCAGNRANESPVCPCIKFNLFVPETHPDEFGFSYAKIYNRSSAMAVKQILPYGDDHQTSYFSHIKTAWLAS